MCTKAVTCGAKRGAGLEFPAAVARPRSQAGIKVLDVIGLDRIRFLRQFP
jgi:hypothetical protein